MFAPPRPKVARTQRSDTVSYLSDAFDASAYEIPKSAEDSMWSSVNGTVSPSNCGAGRASCWLLMPSKGNMLLWNLSGNTVSSPRVRGAARWQRPEPQVVDLPNVEDLETSNARFYISEMDAVEPSLAFCSERGIVGSLDGSVAFCFEGLDATARFEIHSFTCARRHDCGKTIISAAGTWDGLVLIDIKQNGERSAVCFDRATSPIQSSGGRLPAGRRPNGSRRSLWDKVLSAFGNGASSSGADENEEDMDDGAMSVGRALGSGDLCFTHLLLRANYPDELIAANRGGDLMVILYGPLGSRNPEARARWCASVPSLLGEPGRILSLAESRHKVCALFFATPAECSPRLYLLLFDYISGNLVHKVQINTVAGVLDACHHAPPHSIKVHVDDEHADAVVLVQHYCLRVNTQVGVRNPASGVDTIVLRQPTDCLCSALLDDGSVVVLAEGGPIKVIDNVWDYQTESGGVADVSGAAGRSDRGGLHTAASTEVNGNDLPFRIDRKSMSQARDSVQRCYDAYKQGREPSLDASILELNADLAEEQEAHSSNWARANPALEDYNIVVFVTDHLRRRQKLQEALLFAVLENPDVRPALRPDTLAQLVSTQERLVAQSMIRELQNIGSVDGATPQSLALATPAPLADVNAQLGASSSPAGQWASPTDGEEVEYCQQLLRTAILACGCQLAGGGDGRERTDFTTTELVYKSPHHVDALLAEVVSEAESRLRTTAPIESKLLCCTAVARVFCLVAQSVGEVRRKLNAAYDLEGTANLAGLLWTDRDERTGDAGSLCAGLTGAAVAVCGVLKSQYYTSSDPNNSGVGGRSGINGTRHLSQQQRRSMGELLLPFATTLLFYLLRFRSQALRLSGGTSDSSSASDEFSRVLRATLFSRPFVASRIGYPYGEPVPNAANLETSRGAILGAEFLARTFSVDDVLMDMVLAAPVEEPAAAAAQPNGCYQRLRDYAAERPAIVETAARRLLSQGREWELMQLQQLLPNIPDVVARRDAFLARHAPQLLWLVAPQRCDAILNEAETELPESRLAGPTALSHRSRCLALCELAKSSTPDCVPTPSFAESEAVVAAQRQFLSPAHDDSVLGAAQCVQLLLALERPESWVAAARVAETMPTDQREDVLTQIIRRAHERDGDAISAAVRLNTTEKEMDAAARRLTVAQVVLHCALLCDPQLLARVTAPVLDPEEQRFLINWLQYRNRRPQSLAS